MAERPEVQKLQQEVAQEDAEIASMMDQLKHRRIGLVANSLVTQEARMNATLGFVARPVMSNHARMVKTGG